MIIKRFKFFSNKEGKYIDTDTLENIADNTNIGIGLGVTGLSGYITYKSGKVFEKIINRYKKELEFYEKI